MKVSKFSFAYWLFVYLFWRNVYSNPLLFVNWDVFYYWVIILLLIFWIQVPYQIWFANISSQSEFFTFLHGGLARFGIVTALIQVQSLALEILHATGMAKIKKKIFFFKAKSCLILMKWINPLSFVFLVVKTLPNPRSQCQDFISSLLKRERDSVVGRWESKSLLFTNINLLSS